MSAALAPGFTAPVFDGQAVFRCVLDAFARPGLVRNLAIELAPPAPLTPELAAVALALCDPDTPIWLDGPLAAQPAVASYLRFHTGAPIVVDPAAAAFAFASDPAGLPALDRFAVGTAEYPDRSTTLVVALEGGEGGHPVLLSGPGILDEVAVPIALPADFAARLQANHALFPRGVDLLLVTRGAVIGIPRSSSVAG